MGSLRAKLSVAFIAIAVLTTALAGGVASYTARATFRQYVERHPGFPTVSPEVDQPRIFITPGGGSMRFRTFGPREVSFAGRFRNAIWGGTLLAAGVGVLVALYLTKRIAKPIADLTLATRAIAGGSTPPLVPVEGTDELAELGRAFNRMANQLAEDDAQRRRLFAGIVHELRTPLSVIQGTLEGMLDHVIEPTPDRVVALHTQTLLLKRLITDLRDLSLAQAGHLELHRQMIDLLSIAREAVEALAPFADERGVTLRVEADAAVPQVDADPDRVRQALQNLVENALRHTPQGGTVRVVVRATADAVHCRVVDTGVGISPDDLPHVFEYFYRADPSRDRRSGGTGLGLAIVKSLIEAHGGNVTAESQPGRGSAFDFTLPRTVPVGT